MFERMPSCINGGYNNEERSFVDGIAAVVPVAPR